MSSIFDSDVCELLVIAVIVSVVLAQGQDGTTLGKMAAFFTIIGDTLALFALQPELFQRCCKLCQPLVGLSPSGTAQAV